MTLTIYVTFFMNRAWAILLGSFKKVSSFSDEEKRRMEIIKKYLAAFSFPV